MTFVSYLPSNMTIGFVGEKDARPIELNITEELEMWPDSTPVLWYVRPGETVANRADTERNGNYILWKPSLHATEKSGDSGFAQIVFTTNGQQTTVGLSKRMMLTVLPSVLGMPSGTPTNPEESWIVQMTEAASRAEAAASRAEAAASRAEAAAGAP